MDTLDARSMEAVRRAAARGLWIDLPEAGLETAIGAVVSGIVNDFLPGSTLIEMVKNPF